MRRFLYALTILVVMLPFQNCTESAPSSATSSSKAATDLAIDLEGTSLSTAGTGHGYDGKLFAHVDRTRLCADNTHMVASIAVQADMSGLMDRKDCQYISPITIPADQLAAISDESLAFEGKTFKVDPCANRTQPETGTVCASGAVYVGALAYGTGIGRKHVMITPGGCGNGVAPACPGKMDSLTLAWSLRGVLTGLTSETDGPGNTAILASAYNDTEAASYCANLVYASYTDWYLPARDELNFLNQRRGRLADFALSPNRYWSSTEASDENAWSQQVAGSQTAVAKSVPRYVRCMRRY